MVYASLQVATILGIMVTKHLALVTWFEIDLPIWQHYKSKL